MSSRTVIDFQVGNADDTWKAIDQWAQENGYNQKEASGSFKRFQKGVGFLVAPMMLEVTIEGQNAHLEAWVRANLFVRAMALFIVPSEMGIHSGGVKMAVPRKIARNAVNKLLEQLNQPLIE
jgi:hypothetical protein